MSTSHPHDLLEDDADLRPRSPWGALSLTDDVGDLAFSQFHALLLERGLTHTWRGWWRTSAKHCERLLPHALASHRDRAWHDVVLDLESELGATCLPHAVATALDPLADPGYRAGEAGQLLLWHGLPGTGKTHVLRAVAWQWRDWCEVHVVTDPEAFFAHRSDYMLDVLLREGDGEEDEPERWRLLVLEDAGELVSTDAKAQTGQGLSRLLNVVDGVIGQGLRILVLITTNEELRRLNPAVARPGRCASRVEFVPFAPDEASAWLCERGAVCAAAGPATLADLFATAAARERRLQPSPGRRRPIGFTLPA